jgi:hypothetical protein
MESGEEKNKRPVRRQDYPANINQIFGIKRFESGGEALARRPPLKTPRMKRGVVYEQLA